MKIWSFLRIWYSDQMFQTRCGCLPNHVSRKSLLNWTNCWQWTLGFYASADIRDVANGVICSDNLAKSRLKFCLFLFLALLVNPVWCLSRRCFPQLLMTALLCHNAASRAVWAVWCNSGSACLQYDGWLDSSNSFQLKITCSALNWSTFHRSLWMVVL